jgi:TatD DNase family protein
MQFIDTHTHIYLQEFADDLEAVMQRATEAGVTTLLLPAIDSETHQSMLDLEARFIQCRAMMGLHPCSVKADFKSELELIKRFLSERSFIAIGEIGLDFYWDKTFTEQQYAAFEIQIGLALDHNLPISIHSRNATDECIEVVTHYPGLRGVFHCFSGNEDQAKRVIDTGFYLGIGGVVSFKNSGLDRVIEKTGLSRVILETDAPYLAPVPFRGKRNEPAYTRLVAEKLSAITGQSLEQIAATTSANARELFKLG